MIRAGVAGLGWWGRTITQRMAGSDALRVVAAVDVTQAKHKPFAEEHGLRLAPSYAALVADPEIDAVVLCTPNGLHVDQTVAAAAAGKHVFCEKPLALTRAGAARAIAACAEAGVALGVGHERRFEAGMEEIARLVDAGALGTLMHAEANFSHDKLKDAPEGDWRRLKSESPAAGMTGMGVHLSDMFIRLFGRPTRAFANVTARALKGDNGDVVSAVLDFEHGPTAYLNAILQTPLYLRFAVFGTEAWVELRDDSHPDTPGQSTLTVARAGAAPEARRLDWRDTVRANLEEFAAAATGRGAYRFTAEQMLQNVATLEAIAQSGETGAPVAIA